MTLIASSPMTLDEYIQHELRAERRSEYIDGELHEMPGEKDINNELAQEFLTLLRQLFKPLGYNLYINDVKVAIPGGKRYYYPDVFVTKEPRNPTQPYVKHAPELIVEVISRSTKARDYVQKLNDYTTIPSLKYYLIAEPERMHLMLYSKDDAEQWDADVFTEPDEVVSLPALGPSLSFTLRDVYGGILPA